MNEYLKNVNRIEFSVTMACTGRCRHCQNGEPADRSAHVDTQAAMKAVREICEHFAITSLMTFGGEPLLWPDTVCAIHETAAALGIESRQLITNGFFSSDPERIESVARALARSGVNELLLSVDAFHQETIPLEPVLCFARCAAEAGLPVELNPAWLAGPGGRNPYDLRTEEILRSFSPLHIPVGAGNVVFPSGNALKYLREYFDEDVAESSPYDEDPADLRTICFCANGDVLNGNIYETDILELMRTYRP